MKYFGYLMFTVGLILLGIAFTMDTSVAVSYTNDNAFNLPERVNNIGLMADKQNYLLFGSILTVLGALIGVTYEKKDEKEKTEKVCPNCVENIKKEAKVCRYCSYSFLEEKDDNEEFEVDENLVNSLKSINKIKR